MILSTAIFGVTLITLCSVPVNAGIFGHSSADKACQGFGKYKETCEIAKRYQEIKTRAESISVQSGAKIIPDHFRDVIARRFINRSDWEKFLSSAPSDADPRCVYSARPQTWDNWQITWEQKVKAASAQKLVLDSVLEWNHDALVGTISANTPVGKLKQGPNFGNNLDKKIALSPDDISAIQKIKFVGDKAGAIKLSWTPETCREDLPDSVYLADTPIECKQIYLQSIKYGYSHLDEDFESLDQNLKFWVQTFRQLSGPLDLKNHAKDYWFSYACWPHLESVSPGPSCGVISYPQPEFVPKQLNNILKSLNKFTRERNKSEDPIRFAALIQKQFVGLHPFNKGNGRVSRWIMDLVTEANHLPPILVANMDKDLSTADETYSAQAHAGAQESLDRMSACLDQYESANTAEAQTALATSICAVEADSGTLRSLVPKCD